MHLRGTRGTLVLRAGAASTGATVSARRRSRSDGVESEIDLIG
jgi:hypothetical protein